METKTIILSEKEGKRYELHLIKVEVSPQNYLVFEHPKNPIFTGWTSDFLNLPNIEEIAEKLVRSSEWFFPAKHTRYVDYNFPFDKENKQKWREGFGSALESILSAIGDYKYFILTETQI